MKKFVLFISSLLSGIGSFFSQGYLYQQVPDSLNLFNDYLDGLSSSLWSNLEIEFSDVDSDGNMDIIIYDNLEIYHFEYIDNQIVEDTSGFLNDVENEFLWNDKQIGFLDFDLDGDMDVILSQTYLYCSSYCTFYGGIKQYKNHDNEYLESPSSFGPSKRYYTDLNENGFQDYIKMGFFSYDDGSGYYSQTAFFFNPVSQIFEEGEIFGMEEVYAYSLNFIDIDGDGDEDAYVGNGFYHEKIGPSQFSDLQTLLGHPSNLADHSQKLEVGDIDMDGLLDILLFDGEQFLWYEQVNCLIGEPCDDISECTEQSFITDDCNCQGEILDSDFDGLCDAYDNTIGDCTLYGDCDDGDACTYADCFDANCNCAGIPSQNDDDGDGICNALDQCPGQNDNVDNDLNGIPDCLEIQNEVDFEEFDDGVIGPNPNPSDQKSLLQKQIQIFPNPSTGIFTIQSNLKIEILKLFNSLGEELPVFISGKNEIDLSYFSNGIYFLEFRTEEGILRKKIMKK